MSENILFITLSNIGDVILTTPVLQALHLEYPRAYIDIVGDTRSGIIFENCPYRGDIIYKNKRKIFRGSLEIIRKLRKKKYDLIVDLRTDGLTLFLKGEKKATKRKPGKRGIHAVEQHMSIIRDICPDQIIPGTKIWLDAMSEKFTGEVLGDSKKKILAIGPGCHVPEKAWDADKYAAVCNQAGRNFDLVIILGAENEMDYGLQVIKMLQVPCLNLVGKTNLLQAANVLDNSDLYIGNDTGLGHIASAVGTPTVTLFGIGYPEIYCPWGERSIWIQGENNNINAITVEQVLDNMDTIH